MSKSNERYKIDNKYQKLNNLKIIKTNELPTNSIIYQKVYNNKIKNISQAQMNLIKIDEDNNILIKIKNI